MTFQDTMLFYGIMSSSKSPTTCASLIDSNTDD